MTVESSSKKAEFTEPRLIKFSPEQLDRVEKLAGNKWGALPAFVRAAVEEKLLRDETAESRVLPFRGHWHE